MKRTAIIMLLLLLASSAAVGQIMQSVRKAERMKASEDADHDRRLEEEGKLPAPKPAVMNVDVQMVLSKADVKTFAEAKAAEAKRIADGDQLWMYVKFKSKLGDYVVTTRNPEDHEKLRYTLYAEIAPRGDITALHQYWILFAKEDLAASELKIGLAPGQFGRNKSLPILLMLTNTTRSGVWNNEFRLTNTLAMPRTLASNLASSSVVIDFSAGVGKYKKMESEYDSLVLRGTTDVSKMPFAGTYFSNPLKARLDEKLAAENVQPVKVYFSGDDWQESASFAPTTRKSRRVFATFTYRQGEVCRYGLAEFVEAYDFMKGSYAEPEIRIQKDLPIGCAEAN